MAKVAVPVIRLQYEGEDAYTNEIVEEAMRSGFWQEDELTFTGRIVIPIVPDVRVQFIERLKTTMPEEQAHDLRDLMGMYEWSVSFFVDCW